MYKLSKKLIGGILLQKTFTTKKNKGYEVAEGCGFDS
jgi:hypothetical protein